MQIPFTKSETDKKLEEYRKAITEQEQLLASKKSELETLNAEDAVLKEKRQLNIAERQRAEKALYDLRHDATIIENEAKLQREFVAARKELDRINELSAELYVLLSKAFERAKKSENDYTLNNNFPVRRDWQGVSRAGMPKGIEVHDGFVYALNNLPFVAHHKGSAHVTVWDYARGKDSQWVKDLIREHS